MRSADAARPAAKNEPIAAGWVFLKAQGQRRNFIRTMVPGSELQR
jgi:hypothetical protein